MTVLPDVDWLLCGLFCGLRNLARLQRTLVGKLEQPQRVFSSDLFPISFADGGAVEPLRGMIDVLERPIRGKQNSIGADLEQRIDQRLGTKVSRRGQIEMLIEVLADLLF